MIDDLPASGPTVAVCIATARGDQIAALLDGILRQRFTTARPVLEVVVVENRPDGRAAPFVEQFAKSSPWPVRYAVEPRSGVAHVRNRGVAIASSVDFVAFIDDDEVPTVTWLDALLDAQRTFDADVVTGPVHPRFDRDPPAWMMQGAYHRSRRREPSEGDLLDEATCGNALVRRRLLGGGCPFDPAFGSMGGEDSLFFRRAARSGARLVWASEAVVEERVPPERATLRWLLRRAYREGVIVAHVRRHVERGAGATAIGVAAGVAKVVVGSARCLLGLARRAPVAAMDGAWQAAIGLGSIAGAARVRVRQYGTR